MLRFGATPSIQGLLATCLVTPIGKLPPGWPPGCLVAMLPACVVTKYGQILDAAQRFAASLQLGQQRHHHYINA
ncbi:hypothetical protein ACLKA7_006763 [Drosophila subpalustris]